MTVSAFSPTTTPLRLALAASRSPSSGGVAACEGRGVTLLTLVETAARFRVSRRTLQGQLDGVPYLCAVARSCLTTSPLRRLWRNSDAFRPRPPKPGRSPYWRVSGTEYGIGIDRSTQVADKSSAAKLLKQWRDEAKRQHLAPPDQTRGLSFAAAAVSYLRAGRSKLFVKPLVIHFGETPLAKIGQAEIDAAAAAILPNALPQTRNRSVYTPALAIMRHAGVIKAIKRPKWTGGRRLDWLRPDDAFKLLVDRT